MNKDVLYVLLLSVHGDIQVHVLLDACTHPNSINHDIHILIDIRIFYQAWNSHTRVYVHVHSNTEGATLIDDDIYHTHPIIGTPDHGPIFTCQH